MEQLTQLKFEKYSGIGNDFILTSDTLFNQAIDFPTLKQLCPRICDRHFGIGGDGILFLTETSNKNSLKLQILNSDGSEAEMCGNALRCIGKFAFLHGKVEQDQEFLIILEIAQKKIVVRDKGNLIEVDMGNIENIQFEQQEIVVENEKFIGYFIEYGVPHFIIIVPEIKDEYLTQYSQFIQKHHNFKNGTNVDFIKKIDHQLIKIRTFERGCGETLACGTGACSAVIVGILLKELSDQVRVSSSGGDLQIKWTGKKKDNIYMIGPAEFIFKGIFYY